MAKIRLRLFGPPEIYKNDEKVFLPYRKAEALFYYLVIQKQATREELVGLFWGEIQDELAKKNLRNAMYKIRKAFDMEVIHSPQKSIVLLNDEISIISDYHQIMKNPSEMTDLYRGEFLKGFSVKDEAMFSHWLENQRTLFESQYISVLYKEVEKAIKQKDFHMGEKISKEIIEQDPYDERAYRLLMNVYDEFSLPNKGLEVFQNLARFLEEELGVEPSEDTRRLYRRMQKEQQQRKVEGTKKKKSFYFGRERELEQIRRGLFEDVKGDGKTFVLIQGEAGIGKTSIVEHLFEEFQEEGFLVFQTECFGAEKNYILKPWNPIISQLIPYIEKQKIKIQSPWGNVLKRAFPQLQTWDHEGGGEYIDGSVAGKVEDQLIEEGIVEVFRHIQGSGKVLLIFEDLQWIDEKSLRLLTNLMLKYPKNRLRVLATYRGGDRRDVDLFLSLAYQKGILEKLELKRFTREETKNLVENYLLYSEDKKTLKGLSDLSEGFDEIYEETEGNPFFLMEYLNRIGKSQGQNTHGPKEEDLLRSRFVNLCQQAEEVAELTALFFDKAEMKELINLMSLSESTLIDRLENLINEGILKEEASGENIYYRFTHQKLREYCYDKQSKARRRHSHRRIGEYMENRLGNNWEDHMLFSKLIYHFERAGHYKKALNYSIQNLKYYVDFSHELFPVLEEKGNQDDHPYYLSKHQIIKELEDMGELLEKAKRGVNGTEDLYEEEVYFRYIKGRYLIRRGDYDAGMEEINRIISLAEKQKDYRSLIKAYKQKVYYGIQTYQRDTMKENLELGFRNLKMIDYPKEEAVYYRLSGLYHMMMENYEQADETLRYSIRLFNQIPGDQGKYKLNIAAGYNYLGEIRRIQMKFFESLKYYDQAIKICEDQEIFRGLNVFYTKAGQAAFDGGDFLRAKNYFVKALNLYGKEDALWGRSIAEGFMALILFREEMYESSLKCLKNAEKFSIKMKNPYELGIVYRIKSGIKREMMSKRVIPSFYRQALSKDLSYYCKKGIENLNQVDGNYEIHILRRLDALATIKS